MSNVEQIKALIDDLGLQVIRGEKTSDEAAKEAVSKLDIMRLLNSPTNTN